MNGPFNALVFSLVHVLNALVFSASTLVSGFGIEFSVPVFSVVTLRAVFI